MGIKAEPASEPGPEPGATDVQAEMAAFRRRTEARLAQQAEEEKRRLLRAFLQVADNLERALGYGTHLEGENPGDCEAGQGLHQGVELTYRALQQMLAQEGVEPIEAVGQPFDPHLHQALLTTPAEASPGMVIGELERGYRYRGELLRPARVQVAQ
jgi:molecular chaperone GrpE